MPFEISWVDPSQRVILMALPESWRVEEFDAATKEVIRLARSVEHAICVIVDGTETTLPANFIPYAAVLTRKGPRPVDNVELHIIVTPNRLIQSMYGAFLRVQGAGLFANRLAMVDTLAAALNLAEERLKQIT